MAASPNTDSATRASLKEFIKDTQRIKDNASKEAALKTVGDKVKEAKSKAKPKTKSKPKTTKKAAPK